MTRRALLLGAGLLLAACADSTPPPSPAPVAVETRASAEDSAASAPTEPTPVDSAEIAPPTVASAPAELAPGPPATDSRYALLVGIDDYPGDGSDLPSGAADVAAMRALLVETFGYRPENVRVLADAAATRGAVRDAIRDHLGRASGAALLYVSGHGIRLEANAGRADDEADGRDEALYVWADDGRRSALVTDDEIGAWMGALDARRAVVVLDACHSGTGARAGAGGPVPKEVAFEDVADALDPAAPWLQAPTGGDRPVVLLAAARDREVALAGLGGDPSVFTNALTTVLASADAASPLADVMARVSARVRRISRSYGSEHRPQVEGADGLTLGDLFLR